VTGDDPAPSIAGIIETLLTREAMEMGTPLPEYTRHTLKALRQFIEEGFDGCTFQGAKAGAAGLNPATEARLSLAEILRKPDDAGFIGVQGGVVGLLGDVARGMIHSRDYQFTSSGKVDGKPQ